MGKTYRKDASRGKNRGYATDIYIDADTKKRRPNSCRNHGGCDWCMGNRTYSSRKWLMNIDEIDIEEEKATSLTNYIKEV